MVKVSLLILALLGSPQDWVDEDRQPPPENVKLDIQVKLRNIGGSWTFEIAGTTDLPKNTYLRARIYALEENEHRGEKVLDEEAIVYSDPYTGREAFIDYWVDGEEIRVRVYDFEKKPFSLPYRARLYYDPDAQEQEIRDKAGDKKFSAFADIRIGTDEDLKAEKVETAKDLNKELYLIAGLYDELKGEFEKQRKEYRKEDWIKWKMGWHRRVEDARSRNVERYDLWAVWIERQGKLRIDGFCDSFDRIIQDCSNFLEGQEDALSMAQLKMQSFIARMEEAREVIGVDSPVNPGEVRKLILEYEEAALRVEGLAKTGHKPDALKPQRERS